jgi:hypothetical protein
MSGLRRLRPVGSTQHQSSRDRLKRLRRIRVTLAQSRAKPIRRDGRRASTSNCMTPARTSPAPRGGRADCDEHHSANGRVVVRGTSRARLIRLRPTHKSRECWTPVGGGDALDREAGQILPGLFGRRSQLDSGDDPSRQRGRHLAAHVSSQFGRQSLPNADKFVAAPIHVGDLATRVG